jgi:tRNA A-37 threonylcarbamoyl transferase component Bud32
MSPEFHQRVRGIFDKILDRSESERLQYLQEICGADGEMFRAVERLLKAHGASSFFLNPTSSGGRRFGRYVISNELGRGAMGIVYDATDPFIGRAVAVKIIRLQSSGQPGDAGFMRDRLFREARFAGGLSHPGIVTIFDVGQEEDVAFVAMERVIGPSLEQILAPGRRPLDWGKVLDILRQAAAALDYAHRQGVIHRDIKPANVMLHEGKTVKITDFGIAKIVSAAAEQTGTRGVLGTPSHMSPEQIEGKTLDGRSDQFSLAAVAFRLLTLAEPFRADSVAASLHRILYEPRPSACALNPALPPAADKVLQRGLEKTPGLRYENCAEFVNALEKAIQGVPAPGVPPHKRVPLAEPFGVGIERLKQGSAAWAGRPRPQMMAFGLALGASIIFVVIGYFSGVFSSRRPTHAAEPVRLTPQPPVTTAVKPAVRPVPSEPLPHDSVKPPPGDDQSEQARQIYEEAVKYRNAHQQAKALALFRQSASLGDVQAMLELGETFMYDGDGVTADYAEALQWLNKAAKAGDSKAMLDLGFMYDFGNGVDADPAAAAQWFSKAAKRGDPAAMYDLGTMYEDGKGVNKDRAKAKQLYSQAAGLGSQEARKRLAELGR